MYPIHYFWRAVRHYPKREALKDGMRSYTFAELGELVGAVASALMARLPESDERIAIGAANSVEHVVALLSVLAAGKIWVPLNPRSGNPELARIVEVTEPGLLLLDAAMRERLGLDAPTCMLDGPGADNIQVLAKPFLGQIPDLPEASRDAVQAIKFTGGTTGMPKGVMQPCRAWNATILTQWHEYGFGQDDRFLVSAPITHGASTYVLPILGAGGCLVLPGDTKPDTILDTVESDQITSLFLPPTLVYMLTEAQQRKVRKVQSLRRMIYGAAPMPASRIRETQRVFGPVITTTYGQTEAPTVITCMRPEEMLDERNVTSVGRPSPMTSVRITDAQGAPVPQGTPGEIWVRGDLVMTGYWRLPEETQKTIVDGWLKTGDIGLLDERNYLFLKSRSREVIISGGFNIYPSDVEAVLGMHPAVHEGVVFGIDHDKWGEAVHAVVQLRPGASAVPEEIIEFVKRELGSVKAPKVLHILDELPRSPVGKTLKTEVKKRVSELMSATAQEH
ncbi:MAG: class I adenylate-forming enzyme family protein [Noviherbaspirillum sp.]